MYIISISLRDLLEIGLHNEIYLIIFSGWEHVVPMNECCILIFASIPRIKFVATCNQVSKCFALWSTLNLSLWIITYPILENVLIFFAYQACGRSLLPCDLEGLNISSRGVFGTCTFSYSSALSNYPNIPCCPVAHLALT